MVKITLFNSVCQLQGLEKADYAALQEHLSYANDQAEYSFQRVIRQLQQVNAALQGRSLGGDEAELKRQRAILSAKAKELDKERRITMLDHNEFPSGLLPIVLDWLTEEKVEWSIDDKRKEPKRNSVKIQNKVPFPDLRYYQKAAVKKLMDDGRGIVVLPTGCHAKGTSILMFDGTTKKVEDVLVGDLLMGPDSLPRKVLQLARGRQQMAKIIPIKGDSFVVNLDHILSLQSTNEGKKTKSYTGNEIVNITVRDYLAKPKTFKHLFKLYRAAVDFHTNADLLIPPYILGVWLGDGMSKTAAITTGDVEIKEAWVKWCATTGGNLRIVGGKGCENLFITGGEALKLLQYYNLQKNKHIPHSYLTASKEARLELLAGLLDTDGSLNSNGFDFIQKNKELAEQVCFLARSLGLAAYMKACKKSCQTGAIGTYYRISISGDCANIPTKLKRKKSKKRTQKKSVLKTGFRVELQSEDDYYGFALDQDHLYLLSDFTVTHNTGKTVTAAKMIWELGVRTLIITPNKEITKMMREVMVKFFGSGAVEVLTTKSTQVKKSIAICNIQALIKLDPSALKGVDAVFIDEFHHSAAETYQQVNERHLKDVYFRIGLTATNFRNDGADLALQGVLSEVLYEYSVQQAIKDGFLIKPEFVIADVKMRLQETQYQKVYREGIVENAERNKLIADIAADNKDKKLIILVQYKEHGDVLKEMIPWAEFIHGEEKDDARIQMMEDFRDGELMCLIGTSVIGEGVDLPCAEALIMAGGGKARSQVIQNIGRVLRIMDGKEKATVYDFTDRDGGFLEEHSEERSLIYASYNTPRRSNS